VTNLYQLDFNKPIHVHFIGIGGISMSGLAEILLKEHFNGVQHFFPEQPGGGAVEQQACRQGGESPVRGPAEKR